MLISPVKRKGDSKLFFLIILIVVILSGLLAPCSPSIAIVGSLAIISYLATGIFLCLAYIRYLWLIIALAIIASQFRLGDLHQEKEGDGAKHSTTNLTKELAI